MRRNHGRRAGADIRAAVGMNITPDSSGALRSIRNAFEKFYSIFGGMYIPMWLFHVMFIFGGIGLTAMGELIYEIATGKRKFKGWK